jgi:regulator of nucleoside diphosphate kinase
MYRNPDGPPAIGIMQWLAYGLNIALIVVGIYLHSQWLAACGILLSALIISFSYHRWKQEAYEVYITQHELKLKYMNTNAQPVVMTEDDFKLLKPYMTGATDSGNGMSLAHELGRAIIVKREAFPIHTVRLNSKVSVQDMDTNRVFEFKIVMPEHADMRKNTISILTPMGIALIGFRKGEEVRWKVPAGLKQFRIMEVINA